MEIVEQSTLDHFNATLQAAQRTAVKAEQEKNAAKRPKTYDGKSKRSLRRHRKEAETSAKKGYLSVFDYIAYTKERANKGAHMEQLMATALKSKQAIDLSEESPTEEDFESDTEELPVMSTGKRMGLVCLVRHRIGCLERVNRRDLSQLPEKRKKALRRLPDAKRKRIPRRQQAM